MGCPALIYFFILIFYEIISSASVQHCVWIVNVETGKCVALSGLKKRMSPAPVPSGLRRPPSLLTPGGQRYLHRSVSCFLVVPCVGVALYDVRLAVFEVYIQSFCSVTSLLPQVFEIPLFKCSSTYHVFLCFRC